MKIPTIAENYPEIVYAQESITVSWGSGNKKHYESLGYTFSGRGLPLSIPVTHLPKYSMIKVEYQCPFCKEVRISEPRIVNHAGHSYCMSCLQIKDYTGIQVGHLVGVKLLKNQGSGKTIWLWKCTYNGCENTHIAKANNVSYGSITSCGCYVKDNNRKLNKEKWAQLGKSHPLYAKPGSEHPCWNPDLTDKERNRRRTNNSDWRIAVFERDNYRCQMCGRGKHLNAHHLFSYKKYPNYRSDTNNGIALCKKCHRDFHMWNGGSRFSCTPNDFCAWLRTRDATLSAKNLLSKVEGLYRHILNGSPEPERIMDHVVL